MDDLLATGDVVLVSLAKQEGRRPAIVVGVPRDKQRLPMIITAPITTSSGSWAKQNPLLYPSLPQGCGGLPQESQVLLDQIRSLNPTRIEGYISSLGKEYEKIKSGLLELLAIQK